MRNDRRSSIPGLIAILGATWCAGCGAEPYRAPPDPTRQALTSGMTAPVLTNYDETLAYVGHIWLGEWLAGRAERTTYRFQIKIDETGKPVFRVLRVIQGSGMGADYLQAGLHYWRFTPALDEQGRPVPIWWPVDITFPPPMTLELEGMPRGPILGRPAPPGGFRIEDLVTYGPTFTPLTDLPTILNQEEIDRAVGGASGNRSSSVQPVFFLIDTVGRIRRLHTNGMGGGVAIFEPDGRVRDISVFGTDPIYRTVLDIARLYRFAPAKDDGHPVPVWVRILVPLPAA